VPIDRNDERLAGLRRLRIYEQAQEGLAQDQECEAVRLRLSLYEDALSEAYGEVLPDAR
jgi:hypothetical protein